MIYLIGINHNLQHNGNGSANLYSLRNKFSAFLNEKIQEYGITLLAEEFNEEALKINAAIDTVAQHITDKLKIEHIFCDPNTEERQNIGIPSRAEIKSALSIKGLVVSLEDDNRIKEEQRKYHPIREMYWFGKIEKYLHENLIFVCGADHLKGFEALLSSKGYKPVVLAEN